MRLCYPDLPFIPNRVCSVGVVPGLVNGPGYLKEDGKRGAEQMARIAVVNARVSQAGFLFRNPVFIK